MKVPWSWLREYVPDSPDPSTAAELLMVSGTAVEAVSSSGVADAAGAGGEAFRVGRVLEFEQHPDADRLRLVKVDVGEGEPRQIVCGASNFDTGDTVAVVLPGGRMPDGMEIREARLRGVHSRGMMLSERELGLSNDHAGIMVLPQEWQPGEPLHRHVPLGDEVLELEITGNRPDCLGVYGVARELAAAAHVELRDALSGDAEAGATGHVDDHVSVSLEAPELCRRYLARAFVDVRVAPSPPWLKARLAQAGMRAINNVVDVTNYVMLLTAQPLHAFDAEHIRGASIRVRRAADGEKVTTLDGVERVLDDEMLVIADAEQTAVIAGVMGAADVEVSERTSRIVLEAACFDERAIQRASRALGLRSESSGRFEKGLDPHLPEVALRLASRLLVEVCGASMVPGTIDVRADGQPEQPPAVWLPAELAPRVLGIDVSADDAAETLGRLGYEVQQQESGLRVQVPHWRMYDTTRAIDLVEEIGRFRLGEVPSLLPAIHTGGAMLTAEQRMRRLLEDTAAGMGLSEVVTYTLVPAGAGADAGAGAEVLKLANPMTVDHVELRVSLLASLLAVAQRNVAAGTRDVAIFELGRTFRRAAADARGDDGLPRYADERDCLSLLLTGELPGGSWDSPAPPADFPAAAGVVDALLRAAGVDARLEPMDAPAGWLHPGQAAIVRDESGAVLGWVGTVHPGLAARYGMSSDVVAAELELAAIARHRHERRRFHAFSEFPPVLEDIALVLRDSVAAGDVVRVARDAGGDLLESVAVFDRYVGAPVPEEHHSLALRLVFRAADRTLVDEETAEVRSRIVAALEREFEAQLRSS